MNIYIANDHGGYDLKKKIMARLQKRKIWVVNEGSDSRDIVRYPYYASKVANAISVGKADFGILICNSGEGMSIVANKYPNVRAAVVTSEETAELTRMHNNANIICLGGKFISEQQALSYVDIFLDTEYMGERHDKSLKLVSEIEKYNFTGKLWNKYDFERAFKTDDFYKAEDKQPVKILLDTDMLTDCDDVAALAMLLALEKSGRAEIVGITVSSSYPMSAPAVNVITTYYNRAEIPIGSPKNNMGYSRDDSCFLNELSQEFPHDILSNDDAENAVAVMRKALAEAEDNSIKLVSIGYMSNIAALLKSTADEISELSGIELAKQKISEWVCMGGNFPDDSAIDNVNFTRDANSAIYSINNYPSKITFVGRDIGHNIFVGDSFHNMPESSPLRRAYELHRGRYGDNWDHHTADPSTVLYAVYGLSELFDIQSGTMTLYDDCSFEWNPDVGSNMSYLLQKADRNYVASLIDDIINNRD